MERVLERSAGLDVYKKTVCGCPAQTGTGLSTCGSATAELLTLRDWLERRGVTDVAMEGAGRKRSRSATRSPFGRDIIHSVVNPIGGLTGAIHV